MDLSSGNSAWIIFALGLSTFSIIGALVTERYEGRILNLVFAKRILVLVAYSPIIFILPWPDDPIFYLATIGCSILFLYTDLIILGLIKKSNAGVVFRIEPISAWFLFFAWTIVSPALLVSYVETPLKLAGLILSLSACVYFALRLKRCDISWPVLKKIMPSIILIVIGTMLSKTAMDHSSFHSGVWYYGFVQAITMVVVMLFLLRLKTIPFLGDMDKPEMRINLKSKSLWLFGSGLAFGLFTAQLCKYYAISLAENPAYVTIFGLLSPVWISLIYMLWGRKEKADIVSGFGIVLSAAALVAFTQL